MLTERTRMPRPAALTSPAPIKRHPAAYGVTSQIQRAISALCVAVFCKRAQKTHDIPPSGQKLPEGRSSNRRTTRERKQMQIPYSMVSFLISKQQTSRTSKHRKRFGYTNTGSSHGRTAKTTRHTCSTTRAASTRFSTHTACVETRCAGSRRIHDAVYGIHNASAAK